MADEPHMGNAAGSQHWGSAREAHVWAATYDWYAGAIGPTRTRVYAALNAAGAFGKGFTHQLRGRLRHDPSARASGQRLRAAAKVHLHGVASPRAD